MIIVGIILLAVGKLRLTKSLVLVGKKARWYGLTLVITAIPFTLIVGGLIAAVIPESVLAHPVWYRAINVGVLSVYLVLLARPFCERQKPLNNKLPETAG